MEMKSGRPKQLFLALSYLHCNQTAYMTKTITLIIALILCLFSAPGFSQNIIGQEDGGSYPIEFNNAENPCITAAEYNLIERRCAENRIKLGLSGNGQRDLTTTSLIWPLRAASNLNDCGFYTISAGVDHDTTSSNLKDYHCGTKTYDGHRGIDIPIYPFRFYKMDNNQVEVIAAAAGTILYKEDGNFDKNCATNNLDANAIIITHADGSQTHYWHMKSGSLTAKTVGQTVTAGEYLGVVGSSGNSSGPHLHFEVWAGSTVSTMIDPFSGNCGLANSWWASQQAYNNPTAIKVSVNTTDVVVPACPATETPNESNSFSIPFQGAGLSPGYAKFYLFMLYETVGDTAVLSILNPNGSTFNTWTYVSTTAYNASYRGFFKTVANCFGQLYF